MSGRQPTAVVFDHTALITLGVGSPLLSGLVAQAHIQPSRYVYAPALCLTAAIAQRPGLADRTTRPDRHTGGLQRMGHRRHLRNLSPSRTSRLRGT